MSLSLHRSDGVAHGVPRPSIWAGWSTRTRLIAVVVAIDALAALVSCAVIVLNARNAVAVETQASLATVEPLVDETVRSMRSASPESLLHALDLRFRGLRHVRVRVLDTNGARAGLERPEPQRDERPAPAWFADLIAPEPQRHERSITMQGERIGTAQITTEPLDEIDEVWGYALSLAIASSIVNLSVLAGLYLAFGRVLRPLRGLAEGLTQLERHDYTARLDPPGAPELAVIAERFNSVAGTLGEARAANGRLNRQLLTAQDDEGRRIALELHDEFGPCLFALEANAASIARIAEGFEEPARAKLSARAGDIGSIVTQVQARNRELLNRLRPHALGQVPLAECLDLLLRDFERRHPDTHFSGAFEGIARGYGDLVDLTVFRCIQESMTNAVRHGGARHVTASAREVAAAAGAVLTIEVRDDGAGLAADYRVGLGLSGMRERVEALDGSLVLDKASPGTVVRVTLPIDPDRTDAAGPDAPEPASLDRNDGP